MRVRNGMEASIPFGAIVVLGSRLGGAILSQTSCSFLSSLEPFVSARRGVTCIWLPQSAFLFTVAKTLRSNLSHLYLLCSGRVLGQKRQLFQNCATENSSPGLQEGVSTILMVFMVVVVVVG